MSATETEPDFMQPIAREIEENRWFFWIVGGIALFLGFLAVIAPHAATFAAGMAIGIILGLLGAAQALTAFRARHAATIAGALVPGLLLLAAGLLLLIFPAQGVVALTILIGAYFVVFGLVKGWVAAKIRPGPGWGWLMAGAAISVLLGLFIWIALPEAAFWVLGLLVGIDLIFYGAALLAIVAAARRKLASSNAIDI